jgi:hypothetical protein
MRYYNDSRIIEVTSQEGGFVLATIVADSDSEQIGQEIILTQVELGACYNPVPTENP